MWACTYGIDCWIPAELMGHLSTKLMNHLTAKLVDRLTGKLVDRLTTKLVVVNLVKLHLTKLKYILFFAYKWSQSLVPISRRHLLLQEKI